MRSRWKTQFDQLTNQSKFHRKVGDILAVSPSFKSMKCYQEVPVIDLVESYPRPLHRVDWFIESLNTVLELHGAQHYRMVNWGNVGYQEALANFNAGRDRDSVKKYYLEDAGYRYIVIPYQLSDKLTDELLLELIYSREDK